MDDCGDVITTERLTLFEGHIDRNRNYTNYTSLVATRDA